MFAVVVECGREAGLEQVYLVCPAVLPDAVHSLLGEGPPRGLEFLFVITGEELFVIYEWCHSLFFSMH